MENLIKLMEILREYEKVPNCRESFVKKQKTGKWNKNYIIRQILPKYFNKKVPQIKLIKLGMP
jgi:hypothetical protein